MMKQLISIMLIILLAFSAVGVALADAPVFDAIGDQTFSEAELNSLYIEPSDADGDSYTMTLVEDSYTSEESSYVEANHFFVYIIVDGSGSSLQWAPNYADVGDHTFTYTATDDNGEESSETFTITVVSQYVVDVEEMESDLVDLTAELDAQIVLYNDAIAEDDEDDLWDVFGEIISIEEDLSNVQVEAGVMLEVIDEANDIGELDDDTTADLESRIDTIFSDINDLLNTIDEMAELINNSTPGFIPSLTEIQIFEDTPWLFAWLVEDRDAYETLVFNAEETSYTSTSSSLDLDDSSIFYEGESIDEPTSMASVFMEWTPTNDDVGFHYVTITVTDSFGAEDSIDLTFEVLDQNDEPTLASVPDQTVSFNTETLVAETLSYQLEAEDDDGDDLVFIIQMDGPIAGNPEAQETPINDPEVDDSGLFTWTPDESEVDRTFTVTISANDDMGGMSEVITFEVTVTTESAPVIDAIADQTLTVGSTLDLDITATDASVITLEASGLAADASFVDNGDGTADLSWTPTDADVGTSTVTITATDVDGESTTESFTITVEAVVGAPSISSVSDQTVVSGEELSFTIDATDAEGDEITFSTSGLDADADTSETAGDSGSDTLTITWTPTTSEEGDHSVTVTATDANGNAASVSFTITVTEALSEWEQAVVDLEDLFDEIETNYIDDDLEDNYDDAVDDDDADDIEDATEDLEDVLDELDDLMDDIDDLREDVNDAEDDDDISGSEEDDLEEDLDDLEEDVQDLIDEIEDILGINDDNDTDGESAAEYSGDSDSSSSSSSSSTSSDDGDDSDVDVDTTILDGEDTNDSTATVESTSTFDDLRPLLWLGAGIVVALALLIFGLAMLFTKN